MEKIVTKGYGSRRNAQNLSHHKSSFAFTNRFTSGAMGVNLKTKMIAIAFFLYYFVENGTLGLLPEKYYMVYRNVRLSDFILYLLVGYSVICYKEYSDLIKSKILLPVKLLLVYLLIEFAVSAVNYKFPVLEYFFRLKGIWASFLIFPFMLLIKRNGLNFLIKMVFPVAAVSTLLYILTALTGKPFMPDVTIVLQRLPGDMQVFRVFGGTFFGELFFLGIIYFWISDKFKPQQIFAAIFFLIPHILAFGRAAWANILFTILMIVLLNSLRKRNYKLIFRQGIILATLSLVLVISFIKFIPESDYYIDAVAERIFQGKEDVTYTEGTYGTRIDYQTSSLISLWQNNNWFMGIGMHPMWVIKAETFEESIYYSGFCDVSWPSVLAAYGLIGLVLVVIIQFLYIIHSFRLLKRIKQINIYTFILTILFAKMIFDTFITFSYIFTSVSLWGLIGLLNLYFAVFVYLYEQNKTEEINRQINLN